MADVGQDSINEDTYLCSCAVHLQSCGQHAGVDSDVGRYVHCPVRQFYSPCGPSRWGCN